MFKWSAVVSTFRDENVLQSNLEISPGLASATSLSVQKGFDSVCAAYNAALEGSPDDVIVFLHPDVYLPLGWDVALGHYVAHLQQVDPQWAVLGLVGSDRIGRTVGFTFSTGLDRFVGTPFDTPLRARTVDEFAFVVRRSSGLRFDEALPGPQSQLCATDICLEAEKRAMSTYVIPCFALHNSNGWSFLPHSFWQPYLFVRKKWRDVLPIHVPYTRVTRLCTPMIWNSVKLQVFGRKGFRRRTRVDGVAQYYQDLRTRVASALNVAAS